MSHNPNPNRRGKFSEFSKNEAFSVGYQPFFRSWGQLVSITFSAKTCLLLQEQRLSLVQVQPKGELGLLRRPASAPAVILPARVAPASTVGTITTQQKRRSGKVKTPEQAQRKRRADTTRAPSRHNNAEQAQRGRRAGPTKTSSRHNENAGQAQQKRQARTTKNDEQARRKTPNRHNETPKQGTTKNDERQKERHRRAGNDKAPIKKTGLKFIFIFVGCSLPYLLSITIPGGLL